MYLFLSLYYFYFPLVYEWSDGTPVEYTNWEPGEPNDSGGTEECVEAFLNPGRAWNDLDCGSPRHWICRIPKGKSISLQ